MKIELELPYVDEELSIKITIKKDGEVVVGGAKPLATSPSTQPKKKKDNPSSVGGNFMNADF